MTAALFALTVVAALVALYARHDARKAAYRAEVARWAAQDEANRAMYAANINAKWRD